MLKRVLVPLLLLSFVLVPIAALGQLPEGRWWRDPRVIKQLDLSEDQVSALDDAFVDHSRRLIGLKSAVEKEQFELGVLLENRKLDEGAVMKQMEKLGKAKSGLSAEFMRLVLTAREIVGHENFLKIKDNAEKKAQQKMRRFRQQEAHRRGTK